MYKNWIETIFLSYYYWRIEGKTYRVLKLFGVVFGNKPDNIPTRPASGFCLSLYDLGVMWDRPVNNLNDEFGRFQNIQLLSKILGEHVTGEELVSTLDLLQDRINYTIEYLHRWTCYKNIPWLSIRGSKTNAYRVKSNDPSITEHSFMPKDWIATYKGNHPAPWVIVRQAKLLKRMEEEMIEGLRSFKG